MYLYNLYDPRIGKTEEWIKKATESFRTKFPSVHLVWNHAELYTERGLHTPFKGLESVNTQDRARYKLFLNCTGTPFQEVWAEKNREFLQKQGFIVLNS